jgi:hypothetical protein
VSAERLVLAVSITPAELSEGWGGSADEFYASVRATLREVIGDNGADYHPTVERVAAP